MTYPKRPLPPQERLDLAWRAYQQQGFYGAITDLAASFGVSRWLVYHLLQTLVPLLLEIARPKSPGPKAQVPGLEVDRRHLERAIVTLRVVGKVPLEGIQRCLEEILKTPRSIGYLSEVIAQAQQEATAFQRRLDYHQSGTALLDEVFLHQQPILVGVEPSSTAVLLLAAEEHRDADTWGVHLLETQAQGFQITRAVSDGAKGIAAGVSAALGEEVPHQLDVGHLFGQVAQVEAALERAVSKALRQEDERWRVLDSARSERVINRRIEVWEQAHHQREEALALYEDFAYLAEELYGLFIPVGPGGVPRSLTAVRGDLEALLALLEELSSPQVQQVRQRLAQQQEGLLVFWQDWEHRLAALRAAIPQEEILQALLWAYFLRRRKPSRATQAALAQAEAFLEAHLGPQAVSLKQQVASLLDGLPRSSALVETTASWLRPYLDPRKGVSQGFLDLVRLYHNSRTYRRGKRKGHSPLELLGLSVGEDWLALVGLPRS